MIPLLLTLLGTLFLPTVVGFNWTYPVAPRQCSTFTVSVTGGVVFPRKILIVPVGPSPLAYEVRKVLEVAFPTNATTVSFQLPYPTGSKFVGLVSDASGYHGTTRTWTVLSSDDSSCFDATQDFAPPFNFSISPTEIAECQDVRIYWDSANVQSTPSFLSVVPDGPFAAIPLGQIDTQPDLGTGFTWTPTIHARLNLIIVGGDSRGMGTGGFISTFVNPGNPNRNRYGACPSPTAATVASASTSTTSAPAFSTGVIAGSIAGSLGGGIFVLCLILFIISQVRKKQAKPQVPKPSLKRFDLPSYGGDLSVYTVPPYAPPTSPQGTLPPYSQYPTSPTESRSSWKSSPIV